MNIFRFIKHDADKRTILATGQVVPDASRCVQCGVCTYNCPLDIDIRGHVWRNEPVARSQCLTCGECVTRCPRGVLRFIQTDLFAKQTA